MRALGHALDYRETFREIWAGMVYMGHRMRGVETEGDRIARRQGMLEVAMGKGRTMPAEQSQWNLHGGEVESLDVRVEVEEESYDTAGERQWLGVGDPYRARREKSEALEDQIERELKKKGYSMRKEPTAGPHGHHPRGASSWWRRAFDRFSHTGSDIGHPPTQPADEATSPGRRRARPSRSRGRDKVSRDFKTPLMTTYEYDDPPPQSTLHGHRGRPRVNPPANQWSGPILTYEERMQLSPISPTSPESPRHAIAMVGPEYSHRSDPMLARMFPLDDAGRRSKETPLPPLPHNSQAPNAHESPWAARERRWTFGSDGPLNAIAAPASPRSSQDSAFHTARDTLSSSRNPSTPGSGRLRSICIQRTMHLSPLEPPMAGARRKTSLHPIHRHSLACFPYPRRIPPTLVAVIPVEVRNHLAHPWSTKCPVMARRRSSFQRLWRVLFNTPQPIAALDLPHLHNLLLARQDMILASLHDLLSTHTPVDEL
jgi:hypothetical protein